MSHIGAICIPRPSHITTFAALGRELRQRGHCFTFLGIPDIESRVVAQKLEYFPIGKSDFPVGWLTKKGNIKEGITALRHPVESLQRGAHMICDEAPRALKQIGVDLVLVDQLEPAGGTVAEHLDIPFISLCSALPINREIGVPPAFIPWGWKYKTNWNAYLRNQLGYFLFDCFTQPVNAVLNKYRKKWNLLPLRCSDDSFSQLAQISTQTTDFDFPRKALPNCFHYTGPFRKSSPEANSFPYECLTGEPLIYASLGTELKGREEVFYHIAAACENLDAQLVITYGRRKISKLAKKLPGSPLEVSYAPQLELLAKAKLTITHAGLNTALESLSCGVPMVAIPIAHDQPSVAERIRWTGTGEVLPLNHLSIANLRDKVQQVLMQEIYTKNAQRLRDSIQTAGGVIRAADIVEQVLTTGKAVERKEVEIIAS